MEQPAIKALIAACEREYLCDDEPDDSDISHPPSGITMGMIRAARAEYDAMVKQSRLLRRLRKGSSRAMPEWNHLTEEQRIEIIAAVTHCDPEYRWDCAVSVYDKIREVLGS